MLAGESTKGEESVNVLVLSRLITLLIQLACPGVPTSRFPPRLRLSKLECQCIPRQRTEDKVSYLREDRALKLPELPKPASLSMVIIDPPCILIRAYVISRCVSWVIAISSTPRHHGDHKSTACRWRGSRGVALQDTPCSEDRQDSGTRKGAM